MHHARDAAQMHVGVDDRARDALRVANVMVALISHT